MFQDHAIPHSPCANRHRPFDYDLKKAAPRSRDVARHFGARRRWCRCDAGMQRLSEILLEDIFREHTVRAEIDTRMAPVSLMLPYALDGDCMGRICTIERYDLCATPPSRPSASLILGIAKQICLSLPGQRLRAVVFQHRHATLYPWSSVDALKPASEIRELL